MAKVISDMSMSLDGFIAGPNDSVEKPLGDGGERLHQWLYDLASWRELHGLKGGKTNRAAYLLPQRPCRAPGIRQAANLSLTSAIMGSEEDLMTDQTASTDRRAEGLDRAGMGVRLDEERRRATLLSDVREAIFGAQDGLVSTLIVVSAASGATDNRFFVLIAGISTVLAGMFSMAAGEYLSSKSQREIALATIAEEREKVAARRKEVQAELAYMLEEDGLPENDAGVVAEVMAGHPEVLLNVKVEKEFGIAIEEAQGSPLQGAAVMGVAFGIGALAPVLPYLLLPVGLARFVSLLATAGVLFAIGVVKTRWTHGSPVSSGLEILSIGLIAGIGGEFFGSLLGDLLRALLGVPAPG